jgi:hypothetical protein
MKTYGLDTGSLLAINDKINGNLTIINESIERTKQTERYPSARLESLELKRRIAEMKLADLNSRLIIEDVLQNKAGLSTIISEHSPRLSQNPNHFYGSETEIIMLEFSRSNIYKSLYRAADNIQATHAVMIRPMLSNLISDEDQSAIERAHQIVIEKNLAFANKQTSRIEFIRKRLHVLYDRLPVNKLSNEPLRMYQYPHLMTAGDSKHGTSGFLRKHRSKKPQGTALGLNH